MINQGVAPKGWFAEHGNLLIGSLVLFALLADRLIRVQSTPEAPPALRLETTVLAAMILVFHLWTSIRLASGGTPFVPYAFLSLFSSLLSVTFWENSALVAALLIYVLLIGVSITAVPYALTISVVWLLFATLLSRHAVAWDAGLPETAGARMRGLLYLLVMAGYLQYQLMFLMRQAREQRRQITSLSGAVDELTAANMSYNTFVQMAESQAARHERSRITREIHDGVGYALTNLIMLAESTQDMVYRESEAVPGRLTTIRNQAKLALSDTRRALRELRAAEQGLVYGRKALVHMMEVFEQATGVETQREFLLPQGTLEDERIFPVVYRFVQEALTNSFRHGHASLVELKVWLIEKSVIVSVSDNGNAPTEIQEGIGLQGMRERLGEIGGELDYHGLQGFTVIARIPLIETDNDYA